MNYLYTLETGALVHEFFMRGWSFLHRKRGDALLNPYTNRAAKVIKVQRLSTAQWEQLKQQNPNILSRHTLPLVQTPSS